jgi:enoyl-CoA hydratase/carnithine racemase
MTPEELSAAGLAFDVDGAVATVTLDRPGVRNAQTPAMWRALAALGRQISDDVRVAVVRGRGHSFSAGLDRRLLDPTAAPDGEESVVGLLGQPDEVVLDTIAEYQAGFHMLRDQRFISVAVVQGYAIGAGFQLALACDLRVAADDAVFCMREPALGLVPDLTGTKPLVESVGYAKAVEICATARNVSAAEAGAIGLVNAVVPRDELDATVNELVSAVTAHPPGAVRETKALLQQATDAGPVEQSLAERTAQSRRFRELAGFAQQAR